MDAEILKTILDHAERSAELALECVKFLKRELGKEINFSEETSLRREIRDRIYKIVDDSGSDGVPIKTLQNKINALRGSAGRALAVSILKEFIEAGAIVKDGLRYYVDN